MISFALKADKVNCKAREYALECENFGSGIVKTIEGYLEKNNNEKMLQL